MYKAILMIVSAIMVVSGVTTSPVDMRIENYQTIEHQHGHGTFKDEIIYITSKIEDSEKTHAVNIFNTKTEKKEIIYESKTWVSHPQINDYKALWFEYNDSKNHIELILFDRPSGEKISLNINCNHHTYPVLLETKVVWTEAEVNQMKYFDTVTGEKRTFAFVPGKPIAANEDNVFWEHSGDICMYNFERDESSMLVSSQSSPKIIGLMGGNLFYKQEPNELHMVSVNSKIKTKIYDEGNILKDIRFHGDTVYFISLSKKYNDLNQEFRYHDSHIHRISIEGVDYTHEKLDLPGDWKSDLMTDGEFLVWNDVSSWEISKLMGYHLESGKIFEVRIEQSQSIPFIFYDGILSVHDNDAVFNLRLSISK